VDVLKERLWRWEKGDLRSGGVARSGDRATTELQSADKVSLLFTPVPAID